MSQPPQRSSAGDLLVGLLALLFLLLPLPLLIDDLGDAGGRLALLGGLVLPPALFLFFVQRRAGGRPDPLRPPVRS